MYAHELYEQSKPRVVVTYPGRFQPFHQGHAGVFAQLQKQFGADNVYILTSNDTSGPKSPFNFSDKYQLMTAAGVPANHIIETTAMYSLPEGFDPANTIFITAVGSPDADRLRPNSVLKKDKKDEQGNIIKPAGSPSYYRKWGSDPQAQTADQAGYVIVIPEIHKSINIKGNEYDVSHGTDARNLWSAIRDDVQARKEFLTQMYKQPSADLGAIFDKIPAATKEDILSNQSDSTSPIHGGTVQEEAAGVGVIASKKQAKDPRYSNSLTKDVRPGAIQKSLRAFRLAEEPKAHLPLVTPPGIDSPVQQAKKQLGIGEDTHSNKEQVIDMIKKFMPVAMKELKITKLPRIIIKQHLEATDGQATFGRFVNDEEKIYLAIADRHPVDILRTLAHELTHWKQYIDGEMYPGAGDTGSPIENEAHVKAGIIMRHFNKKYPDAVKAQSIEISEAWSEKYKRSINCNNPKGFSQRAHCQGRKKNEDIEQVEERKKKKKKPAKNKKYYGYGYFPAVSTDSSSEGGEAGLEENFADGKNPQDKGDSKRYNVPTKAKISTLRKIAKQGGRRGQLAHWLANMKSGRRKKK